jgi:Conjugative transposon protein TcpC
MEAGSIMERIQVARRSARAQRLRARVPRYLFVGFIAITSLVGIRQIWAPAQLPSPAPPAPIRRDAAAEDFALQFTRAYLEYDPRHPQARERVLARFLPQDLDLDAGLTPGRRAQRVTWSQVASEQPSRAGATTIVVAVGEVGAAKPVYLAVPVERRREGSLELGGYPSLVGPPPVGRGSLPDRAEVSEKGVVAVARRVVTNYLAGEGANLAADLVPDAPVTLPTRELHVRSLDDVVWADGPSSNAVLVTVEAADGRGALWTLTYELGITNRAGRPYVTYVQDPPGPS